MAGEPESLHVHEPLKARLERHDYDRLLMLSDGVFAIAITLLALELKLPPGWNGSIEQLLSATGRPLVGYLFGCALVGVFWFVHRRLIAQLEQVDGVIAVLNLLLLGLVGLTPYVARMIAEAGPTRAMPFYLVAVASVFGSVALIQAWASFHPRLLHAGVDRVSWRTNMAFHALSAVGLGGVGSWAIATHRPFSSEAFLAVALILVGGRRLTRRWPMRAR